MEQSIGLKKLNIKDFHGGFSQQFSIPTYMTISRKKNIYMSKMFHKQQHVNGITEPVTLAEYMVKYDYHEFNCITKQI